MRYLWLISLAWWVFLPRLWAADVNDFINPAAGTMGVAQQGGDTVKFYQVTCASFTAATSLRPAVTDRSRRRLRVQNTSGIEVILSSSSVLGSAATWTLGTSTETALSNVYDTFSSAQFFCAGQANVSPNVKVSEETASNP